MTEYLKLINYILYFIITKNVKWICTVFIHAYDECLVKILLGLLNKDKQIRCQSHSNGAKEATHLNKILK